MRNWTTMMGCVMAMAAGPSFAQLNRADGDGQADNQAQTIRHSGELGRGDRRQDDGSYFDEYEFTVVAGQTVTIDLTSDDIDTIVYLESPSGEEWQNDDHNGQLGHSHLSMMLMEAGEYTVVTSSFGAGETGDYRLEIALGPAPDEPLEVDRQTRRGSLARGDRVLEAGEYYDTFPLEGRRGDQVTITLDSDDFDTYLVMLGDDDNNDFHVENDDHNGSLNRSQLSQVLPRSGDYTIYVTSYAEAETGNYTLTIETISASGVAQGDDGRDDPVDDEPDREPAPATPLELAGGDVRTETGTLTDNDDRLGDDSPYDAYRFRAREGETFAIDLRSDELDPYLVLEGDRIDSIENDDHNGSLSHSRIVFTAPANGEYTINATCFDPTARGAYTLTISPVTATQGSLARGDDTLANDEYIDWYEIQGEAGQLMMLQVTSDDFDTYLILEDPGGAWEENDDAPDTSTSIIESNVFQPGTYRVGVTSFSGGETGDYTLTIAAGEGYTATPTDGGEISRSFDGTEPSLANNGYVHAFSFDAEAGSTVIINMASEEVDTFIKLTGPGQFSEMNDDSNGTTDSQMAFRVLETGTFYLSATTYSSGETGAYTLDIQLDANKYDAGDWALGEGGEVYGVFVGLADYPDSPGDLPNCDNDAINAAEAFSDNFGMRDRNAITLTNDDATPEAIREALERMGRQVGPNDMFVFFFSGHGDQVARDAGPDIADPDGNNETLEAFGGAITDDEFAELLNGIDAGTSMVVIDSCFSGGFAKDVVTRPGRIGLFSSEGDCLSMVADELNAGGYLSFFFVEALDNDRDEADANGDRMLTAHELTFYLQDRFADVVQSEPRGQRSSLFPNGAIDPSENLCYQQLIIDRDAVSPHLILVDW